MNIIGKKMPHKKLWQRTLTRETDSKKAKDVISCAQEHYDRLRNSRESYTQKVLETHLDRHIFPHLALYQALLDNDFDRPEAFGLTQTLHFKSLKWKKRFFKFLAGLPFSFRIVRFLTPRILKSQHPDPAWEIRWLENSPTCVHFEVLTCFYNDMVAAHGCPELAVVFCNGDDFVFDNIAPHIKWGRTQTITRGSHCCDTIYHNVPAGWRGQ